MSSKKVVKKVQIKETDEEELVSGNNDKTVIKTLSLAGGHGGGCPTCVDVKDGKVLRIRPLHYDWKYSKEEFNPWKYERNGKLLNLL